MASRRKRIGKRLTRGRKAFFSLLVLLLCLLLLLAIEGGARLLGLGYPTRLLVEEETDGKRFLAANHQFFRIFFPRAMYRSPQAIRLTPEPARDTVRILLFGESAAMGDPEPAWGPARILERLLEARHPGTDYEVVNLAVTAINSHVILPMAREAARRIGSDFWCLYMGNNEVHAQFGPGTVFGSRASSLGWIRAGIRAKKTRIGQLANSLLESGEGRAEWGGMEMFAQERVSREDPRLESVYRNFERNLEDIVACGLESGAQVLVGTVAVNLRDCSPLASIPPDHLAEPERRRWEGLLEEAGAGLREGRHAEALEEILQALELHPGHAQLHYLAAQCHWGLGDDRKALKSFQAARDWDALRFRTDDRLNRILRQSGESLPPERAGVVDIDRLFLFNAPRNIPGNELFWDHVHFRFPGSYLAALAFAREIESRREDLPRDLPGWLSLDDCARDLALTLWSDWRMTRTMQERMGLEPFLSQSVHPARHQRFARELEDLSAGMAPEAFPSQRDAFHAALGRDPLDYQLRYQFGLFLQDHGRTGEAIGEWQRAAGEMPLFLKAHFQAGLALVDLPGRAAEAEAHFRQALRIRPHTADILIGLGRAQLAQGLHRECLEALEAALELRPGSKQALLLLAQASSALGREGKARSYRRRAESLEANRGP